VLTGHLAKEEARKLGVQEILPSVSSLPQWIASITTIGR
jgi:hypothetical protein